ncbi:MAG: hypothetical protein RR500_10460, partial [Bacilli bacterium]
MYNIIKLLNLEDDNFSIDKVDVVNQTKVITISKAVSINFCPLCNTRMYSRGIRLRKVNHPIMQDGYTLT